MKDRKVWALAAALFSGVLFVCLLEAQTTVETTSDGDSSGGGGSTVATTSALFSSTPSDGDVTSTRGYSSDGIGAGTYYYDADGNATINGGTVLPGTDGTLSFDSDGAFDGDAGTGRWILVDQSEVSVDQFGAVGDDSTDDWNPIQRAIIYLAGQPTGTGAVERRTGTGIVKFNDGHYQVSKTLDANGSANLTLSGTQMESSFIEYTGTSGSLFEFGSSYNLRVENLTLTYTSASLTDALVIMEHATHTTSQWVTATAVAANEKRWNGAHLYRAAAAGTTGGTAPTHSTGTASDGAVDWVYAGRSNIDPRFFKFDRVTFAGSSGVDNAAVLVDLNNAIVGSFRDCNFYYAERALYRTDSYANVIRIENCEFANTLNHPIYDAGESWQIVGCTFEPRLSGYAGSYEGNTSSLSRGLLYEGNWHGDVTADGGTAWIEDLKTVGATISGNFFGTADGTNPSIEIASGSQSHAILGNRFESDTAIGTTATVRGLYAAGNDVSTDIIDDVANVSGLSLTGNEDLIHQYRGSSYFRDTSTINATRANAVHVAIGALNALPSTSTGNSIARLDAATGYTNGSLGIFSNFFSSSDLVLGAGGDVFVEFLGGDKAQVLEDWRFEDRVMVQKTTLATNDATPAVADISFLVLNNSVATTVTDFDQAAVGQLLTVLIKEANTGISDSGDITLDATDGAYTAQAGGAMFVFQTDDGTTWYEISRRVY